MTPPGPWKLPLIGNLHQLSRSLPHRCLAELAKKHGPFMHLQLGQVSTIVVSSPDMAQDIYKTHDIIFCERPSSLSFKITTYDSGDLVCAPYGDYWMRMRKDCIVQLFSQKQVQSLRPIREEEVSNLIKSIYSQEGSPVNISEKLLELSFIIITRATFGEKNKDQEAFKAITLDFLNLSPGFHITDFYPSVKVLHVVSGIKSKLKMMHQDSDKILNKIMDDHKEKMMTKVGHDQEDLIDVLLKLKQKGEFSLTDINIKAIIWEFFVAGSETSAITTEWALAELLKNPRLMKKAQAEVRRVFNGKDNVDESNIHELKFLKSIVKETLRLHPPAPLSVPRESIESCEINGYAIPAKTRLMVNLWAISRDPRYWSEVETFYPERFLQSSLDYKGADFEYIPFGAGRRMCPGLYFGVANVELMLAQLLFHFDWKLPTGVKPEDLDMSETFGIMVKKKNDLVLTPIPYNPLFNIK